MSIELNSKQLEGLQLAVARYKERKPYTVISGYAGSGKSTLVKYIVAALELDPEIDVCYVAFTGKAATVLRQKGCPNAKTAHKLLYTAKPMPDGSFKFIPRSLAEDGWKLIIVDEVSMLPLNMWEQLLKQHVPVIACGDPGQLPAINPDDNNHVLDNPHIFLDEIMRQAQNSEIIRLSMWVREGKPLAQFPCENKEVKIIDRSQLTGDMLLWADQILCATNDKRNEINRWVRELKGLGDEPTIGDKITSLTNHWDFESKSGEWALTNGTIGEIKTYNKFNYYAPRYIYSDPIPIINADLKIEDEDDYFLRIPIDYTSLITGKKLLDGKTEYLMRKNKNAPTPPFDFNYAYAITTHRSQGSQWDKILVFEENYPFKRDEHMKWLYTAVTRAVSRVVIVRK